MICEISQTEKDKQCMISLICGILNQTTKLNSYIQRVDWWLPDAECEGCVKCVKKSSKLFLLQNKYVLEL